MNRKCFLKLFAKLKYYRFAILLILVSLFIVSCTQSKTDDKKSNKIVVALDWYINPDHGPLLVAQSLGYFRENGINVSFITPTETSAPSQLLCAGKADVALVYEPQYIAQLAGGMPIECAGTLINKILCCVAVLKDSGINNLSQLKGKSVGYSSDGTGNAILGAMLEYNDLKLDQVGLINLQMNLSQALLSKRVNAVYGMMRNVEPVQLKQEGVDTILFYPEENGVPMYSELLFAVRKSQVSSDKIKKFLSALKKAVDYINENPQKAWTKIAEKYQESLAMTKSMEQTNHLIWNATIQYFAQDPELFNKKQFNTFAKFLCNKGTISKLALNKMLYKNIKKDK